MLGLGPRTLIYPTLTGYAPTAQFFLEAFQWHGVKRGDAFAFYAGDIGVEGPHPFCSNGGNLGTGPMYTTASSRSAALPALGRSGFGRGLRWRHLPRKQWRLDHVRQTPALTAGKTEITGSAITVRLRDSLPNALQVRYSTSAAGILASRIR